MTLVATFLEGKDSCGATWMWSSSHERRFWFS